MLQWLFIKRASPHSVRLKQGVMRQITSGYGHTTPYDNELPQAVVSRAHPQLVLT